MAQTTADRDLFLIFLKHFPKGKGEKKKLKARAAYVLCIDREDALVKENLALVLTQTFGGLPTTKGAQLSAAWLWDYFYMAVRPSESSFNNT